MSELANELENFFDSSQVKVITKGTTFQTRVTIQDKVILDFLKCNVAEIVKEEMERRPGYYKSVKLLSNLPYHITTPVLQKVMFGQAAAYIPFENSIRCYQCGMSFQKLFSCCSMKQVSLVQYYLFHS